MLQHLLYIVAQSQLEQTKIAMKRLKATPLEGLGTNKTGFHVKHDLLGALSLNVILITDLDQVTSHLRQNPVDLMIYDERGKEAPNAIEAIQRIRADVKSLADVWGPEFLFPLRRAISILNDSDNAEHRSFELGRLGVRDVVVEPHSTAHLLRWIRRVLYAGVLRENRVGIALSGGGIEGFLYQLGVIHALNKAMLDRDLYETDVVSGVSSGALAGTMLAAHLDTNEIIRSIHNKSEVLPNFTSQTMFDLAVGNIGKRVVQQSFNWNIKPSRWLANLQRTLPTGFFKGDALEAYIAKLLKWAGQPDRFDDLATELYIGVTDQDSYKHIIFGEQGQDKMKITEAVRASCAFPLVFTPKQIHGRRYIDGQVTRSCNLDITIKKGCSLVFVIDPLKPAKNHRAGAAEAEGGFFTAVQVIKALCSTRFETNLKHVTNQYPDADFIIFQPDEECAELMSGSPMRYRIRTQLIELAYKSTLRKLRNHHLIYSSTMARYGFDICGQDQLRELEQQYDDVFKTSS